MQHANLDLYNMHQQGESAVRQHGHGCFLDEEDAVIAYTVSRGVRMRLFHSCLLNMHTECFIPWDPVCLLPYSCRAR